MKDLLEYIVFKLVDDVDAVSISEREDDRGTVLELKVASADMGKVIGKEGRIAKAIRTVVRSAALRGGEHYFVEIVQNEQGLENIAE